MSDRYTIIKTDLINPDLETEAVVENQNEPILADVPQDLYAAITTQPIETDSNQVVADTEVKQYSYTVPTRLYTLIVPEKPPILAEERIFVYVPKVTVDNAGIARFAKEHFNVLNGEVSLNEGVLAAGSGKILITTDKEPEAVDFYIRIEL